jgi:hypothetical protein
VATRYFKQRRTAKEITADQAAEAALEKDKEPATASDSTQKSWEVGFEAGIRAGREDAGAVEGEESTGGGERQGEAEER